MNTFANGLQTVDKGCRLANSCFNQAFNNNNIFQNTQCCASNGCNLLINPNPVTQIPTTVQPVTQGPSLQCYACTDCGFMNIGTLTTCAAGFSCSVGFYKFKGQHIWFVLIYKHRIKTRRSCIFEKLYLLNVSIFADIIFNSEKWLIQKDK